MQTIIQLPSSATGNNKFSLEETEHVRPGLTVNLDKRQVGSYMLTRDLRPHITRCLSDTGETSVSDERTSVARAWPQKI
jgi:hypothetical protein